MLKVYLLGPCTLWTVQFHGSLYLRVALLHPYRAFHYHMALFTAVSSPPVGRFGAVCVGSADVVTICDRVSCFSHCKLTSVRSQIRLD